MMKKRSSKSSKITSNIKSKAKSIQRKVTANKERKTSTNKMSKKKRMILNVLLVGVIAFVSIMIVFFAYVVIKAPKFDPNNLKFTQMSELYDTDGNLISKMGFTRGFNRCNNCNRRFKIFPT